jgi:hypothetical protein
MLLLRIFPRATDQAKKVVLKRNLSMPNSLPREEKAIITNQDIVEGSNIKQPLFGGSQAEFVFACPSPSD